MEDKIYGCASNIVFTVLNLTFMNGDGNGEQGMLLL